MLLALVLIHDLKVELPISNLGAYKPIFTTDYAKNGTLSIPNFVEWTIINSLGHKSS